MFISFGGQVPPPHGTRDWSHARLWDRLVKNNIFRLVDNIIRYEDDFSTIQIFALCLTTNFALQKVYIFNGRADLVHLKLFSVVKTSKISCIFTVFFIFYIIFCLFSKPLKMGNSNSVTALLCATLFTLLEFISKWSSLNVNLFVCFFFFLNRLQTFET